MEVVRLVRLLEGSQRAVVFTGAGVSTESGIPDFRSSQGLWRDIDPMKVASIGALREDPEAFYAFYRRRLGMLEAVKPNRAHEVIALLEERGYVRAVITQNVDGLHQKAGSRRVLELHGSLRKTVCLDCEGEFGGELLAGEGVPECPRCGGVLKPGVVLFGEPLPNDVLEEAYELSRQADLHIVLGSSLVVSPANTLPQVTLANGGSLAIVNLEETPLDLYADVLIRARLGETMDALAREMGL